ncbi:MAG: DUF2752 domain-containing protein [Alistipes sp.]|nr:DUF2752 domain-containing protein [Alistipes sp.]
MIYIVFYLHDWTYAPRCIFRSVSGYDCPMCGAQRAIADLLLGDLKSAFWHNPYLIVISPYVILISITVISRKGSMRKLKSIVMNIKIVSCYAVLMIIWWFFRNTSMWHTILSSYI